MNSPEVDELLEVSVSQAPPQSSPAPLASNPSFLRLAYALEFLVALIAIVSMWSEIGGEGHLDLMPWYVKLACIVGLAWCAVRFTAAMVEQQKVWTLRTAAWFAGILLFCIAMAGITYYYHLHEEPDDGDDNTTASALNITNRGSCFHHASRRTERSIPICFLARAAVSAGDRLSFGSHGGSPRLRL